MALMVYQIFCILFIVSQNERWRTPQQLTFKQQEIVKDFSFEGVQAKRMERGYAVLNRSDVLFEDSM